MKYYIAGKKNKEGSAENDSEQGNLSEYFELGWEYMTSHLILKRMYVNGTLKENDVIVTLKDRMFLYEGFWNKVISFEEFQKLNITSDIFDFCDLAETTREAVLPKINNGKYEYWNTDINVIKNIKYPPISEFKIDSPYCCLHIRYRKWASYRNLSKEFWFELINEIKRLGINIYIFGKGAEEFSDGIQVFHVELSKYASLLNNQNCKFLIGSFSGGTLISQTFSNQNCVHYILITDKKTYEESKTNDAYKVFHHCKEMNFSEAPISFVSLSKETKNESNITINQMINELQIWKKS